MNYLNELLENSSMIINKSQEVLNLLCNITIDDGNISIKLSQDELENNYNKYIELIYNYNNLRSNFRNSIAKVVVKEIDKLKELVIRENKILHMLNSNDIEDYLDKLDTKKIDDIKVVDRVRERLIIRNIILNGKNIDSTLFLDNSNIEGFEFDIHDVILAMVHIEVFKILKNKLDNIKITNEKDKHFRRDLYEYYERAKFNYFSNMPTFEFISLLYNTDMTKVPSIDIDIIKEHESINDEDLEEFFINMTTDTIDVIASINDNDLEDSLKNADEVFDYLFDITLFEVIISYMDIEALYEVSDYCKEIMKDNNKINIGHINNLVKKRLKD